MDFSKVALLLASAAVVTAFAPFEEYHVPKPYSFGYKIKDKHGEQHRQEIGDGLHSVKGSYGFKDERGIERQVNYVADKGGFRAKIKTNEPGTAPLSPAAVIMESSAHPYYGTSKGLIAGGVAKGSLAKASGFGFPGFFKLEAEDGLAFDTGLAKEQQFGAESLAAELAKPSLAFGAGLGLDKLAKEFPPSSPVESEKEAEAAKSLEEFLKQGFVLVPINLEAAKEAEAEKEKLAVENSLAAEELAKLGLVYSPFFGMEGLKESEFKKKRHAFGNPNEFFPFAPKYTKAPLPFLAPAAPKPTGFAYGGPLVGGFVKGYNARFF